MMILALFLLLFVAKPSTALRGTARGVQLARGRARSSVRDDAVVYDGVLTGQTCEALSRYVRGKKPGFAVFDRHSDEKVLAEVEVIISSILKSLSDNSRYVEWWTVTKWRSHELHRDVDEQQVFEQGVERHPRNGHVLYLSLDPLVANRGGSTVVLSEDKSRLWICPPSPGRLLRFNGTLLHGVPRPALEYLYNAAGSPQGLVLPPSLACLASSMPLGEDEHLGRDDGNRVVLLFNTWPVAPPAGSQPLALEEADMQRAQLNGRLEPPGCCSPATFVPEAADSAPDAPVLDLLIPLPADRRRRDTYEAVMGLHCSPSAIEAMLINRPELKSPPLPPRVVCVWPAKKTRGRDDD